MIIYRTLPKCFPGKRKQHCFIQKFKFIGTFPLIYTEYILHILTFFVTRSSYVTHNKLFKLSSVCWII